MSSVVHEVIYAHQFSSVYSRLQFR